MSRRRGWWSRWGRGSRGKRRYVGPSRRSGWRIRRGGGSQRRERSIGHGRQAAELSTNSSYNPTSVSPPWLSLSPLCKFSPLQNTIAQAQVEQTQIQKLIRLVCSSSSSSSHHLRRSLNPRCSSHRCKHPKTNQSPIHNRFPGSSCHRRSISSPP